MSARDPLTVKSARIVLRAPFTFGDPDQIAAGDLIEKYERALAAIREFGPVEDQCSECGGDGAWTCSCACGEISHQKTCDTCGGCGVILISEASLENMTAQELVSIAEAE